MPAAVCKFWQQGSCRYGDRCRYEHPPINQGVSSGNRFAALQNSRNDNGYQSDARANSYSLDKAAIIADLSTERPQWILSAYGPGRQAPAQLFGGPLREQSFEEMRLLHYMGQASGNAQQAAQEADKLYQASEQQNQAALNNVDGAIDFIIKAENEHPNRIDICRTSTSGPASALSPPNQESGTTSFQTIQRGHSTFGSLGQSATGSGFGSSSAAAPTGAFGQPSTLGQKPNPFGGTAQKFGAPSQLDPAGAFGRPSALGQKPNPFGAPTGGPSLGNTSSATGPFSSFAGAANPFLQAPQQQIANPFGGASQPPKSVTSVAPPQPENQNPFGQNSTQVLNPPSQPNPFANAAPAPFGAPSASQGNLFGQPSTRPQTGGNIFGNAATSTANPFAQKPSTQALPSNPFSSSQPSLLAGASRFGVSENPSNQQNGGGSGFQSQPLMDGNAQAKSNGLQQDSSLADHSAKGIDGRSNTFKGMTVTYKDDEAGFQGRDGRWHKIWFPQGDPAPYKDTEMADSFYDESIKAAYSHLKQSGSFQGSVMPMIPPKREWCSFDF